AQTW
ncbi:ketopantoate hydroxymethyltransferase family protein, partial [Vibrio parahaemolyticus VP2007-007]